MTETSAPNESAKITANREMLLDAQKRGGWAVLGVFTRLSGPGWLQSAITLGGGSLAGSLFLGVLGGTSLMWLQLLAITMGVVMLSAISYVTLSTGQRPFPAINRHINPVLGWGWLIATMMANIIWCMPQFSLCFAALQENLVGKSVGNSLGSKLAVSAVILAATFTVVMMNLKQGIGAKIFDLVLKTLVGMIVICFFGVVVYLSLEGTLDWGKILMGFIPNFSQLNQPTGDVAGLVAGLPESLQQFWTGRIVPEQRAVMIAAAATAVGINMTFLLPYSMLNRGWDKPFRGLARFDLSTGMAIPYVLVTSCVVIASASSFHAVIDDSLASTDPAVMSSSDYFKGVQPILAARLEYDLGSEAYQAMSEQEQLAAMANLSPEEKRIATSLVRRDAFQLSKSLAPLLGEDNANYVFGLGIFGMGFSTIIILMLINGYAFCELLGIKQGGWGFVVGCLIAGLAGAAWPMIWDGPAKLWLAILASSFGALLLPIAYFTFFLMMNNRDLMGDEKPKGGSMAIWNILMVMAIIVALAAAVTAVIEKASDPKAGWLVISVTIGYLVLVVLGFVLKSKAPATAK
ncbi:divalent metal cation transporter [Aureliella helgolandensis]|uniref:Divalent metal cation transporter MntH n=1 Tax=Aureliella helgolandensis TaxID=2527968 RepID=A0A518FZM1_9BACT|nr:divalent metal cation transporter [Aureliella helgolandensis]QDV21805.1 Divalent metal cation transporter MntH [Aureliella helgolandensis]